MTLELDSKPTRTRKGPFAKELAAAHEQVAAEEAAETEAAKWAAFDADIRESLVAEENGAIGKTTAEIREEHGLEPGEIPMSPEALAELRARAALEGDE